MEKSKSDVHKNSALKKDRIAVAAVVLVCVFLMLAGALLAHEDGGFSNVIQAFATFHDGSGEFGTINTAGNVKTESNPFFQDLGTNGRRCITCHEPADAWTVTPQHIQQRFEITDGTDPIFRTNDGSTCPTDDVSTKRARREAYSLLLNKGLIRIELSVPVGAEFTVLNSANPYGCTSIDNISVYRRPLPTTNIPFLSTIMWDGRETLKDAKGQFLPVSSDLAQQAIDATNGHAQAAHPPTPAQVQSIVDFETKLFTAQLRDDRAGELDAAGAQGGPKALTTESFFIGINDPLGGNPKGTAFSPIIFNLFDRWTQLRDRDFDEHTEARRSVARGQALFNSLRIPITGVAGLNDALNQPVINGFCGTCHDTFNAGDHSVPAPLNIGIADASRRTSDLPLITLMNNKTGAIVQTSDPGRALITGKWADVGKFKGPILRGLAGRAPYFHNGSSATLGEVVDFYNTRFNLNLSRQNHEDLVAFLMAL